MFDEETATPGGTWTVPLGWRADNEGICRSCGTSHFANCPQATDWRKRA